MIEDTLVAPVGPLFSAGPEGTLALSVPADVHAWLEGGMVTAHVGFDLDFEGRQLAAAGREDRPLLSIRVGPDEALIGPLWLPGRGSACAGCAEARIRLAVDHPLLSRADVNASPRSGWPAALAVLVEVGVDHLGRNPLKPGDMLRVGLTETRRHRVVRSIACPLCGPRPAATISRPCLPLERPGPSTCSPAGAAIASRSGVAPARPSVRPLFPSWSTIGSVRSCRSCATRGRPSP